MSSEILLTGASKETHFVKFSQKDVALTPPKAMERDHTAISRMLILSFVSLHCHLENAEKRQCGNFNRKSCS